jgi:hypothetical protein
VALNRYAAGELDGPELEAFESHLEGCAHCRQALSEFDALAGIWDAEPEEERPFIQRLLGPGRLRWAAGLAAAAALALVLVLVPFGGQEGREGVLTPKGYWQLHVAAERDGKTFRVTDGSVLKTGDQLGFFYTAEKEGYLTILYVEESLRIVRLYPTLGTPGGQVTLGKNIRIPDGAVLSPATGCEWIVGLFSEQELAEEIAMKSVSRMVKKRRGCTLDAGDSQLKQVAVQVIQVIR